MGLYAGPPLLFSLLAQMINKLKRDTILITPTNNVISLYLLFLYLSLSLSISVCVLPFAIIRINPLKGRERKQ